MFYNQERKLCYSSIHSCRFSLKFPQKLLYFQMDHCYFYLIVQYSMRKWGHFHLESMRLSLFLIMDQILHKQRLPYELVFSCQERVQSKNYFIYHKSLYKHFLSLKPHWISPLLYSMKHPNLLFVLRILPTVGWMSFSCHLNLAPKWSHHGL